MQQEDRVAYSVLREHFADLCASAFDPSTVANELFSKKIINQALRDVTTRPISKNDQRKELVDGVMRCGRPGTFKTFLEILNKDGEYLAEKMRDAYSKLTGVYIPLENGGPPTSGAQITTQPHTTAFSTQNSSTELKAYKMKSPHGIALVISNITFNPGTDLDYRVGADADEVNISELFKLLSYKVVLLKNLEGEAISMALQVVSGYKGMTFENLGKHYKEKLKLLSSGDNLIQANHDSFVCCLLSHGTTGQIYGINKETFDLKNIYEYIGSCKYLSGKPKMMFVQACQGDQIAQPDGADPPPTAQPDGKDPSPIVQSDESSSEYNPHSRDFLMSFAAFYGQMCFREGKGSWYVNALCRIFKDKYKEKDVLSMITEVHKEVMKEEGETSDGELCYQCPRLEHTLRYSVQLTV